MRFRIRPKKAFTSEIRSIAESQFDLAISLLKDRPEGLHEAIHDARRCFKRLRALYRLIASEVPDFQKRENVRIRDLSKSLSAVRDATSLIEACEYLRDYTHTPHDDGALTRIIRILQHRRSLIAADNTLLEAKTLAAVAVCDAARGAVHHLILDDRPRHAAGTLAHGWRRSVQHARKAIDACEDGGDGEALHELRKRSQDYWMYVQLLRSAWSSAMHSKQADIKRLVDLLGHSNDLTMLRTVIENEQKRFDDADDRETLLHAISVRQQALREEALPQARLVFADDERQESHIVRQLWLLAHE